MEDGWLHPKSRVSDLVGPEWGAEFAFLTGPQVMPKPWDHTWKTTLEVRQVRRARASKGPERAKGKWQGGPWRGRHRTRPVSCRARDVVVESKGRRLPSVPTHSTEVNFENDISSSFLF